MQASDHGAACPRDPGYRLPGAASPPAAVLDHDRLIARCGGDADLAQELLGAFAAEAPRLQAQVRSGLEGGSFDAVARAAHQLKGSLGAIADRAALESAALLESAARDGDVPAIEAAHPLLESALEAVLEEIIRGTGRPASSGRGGVPQDPQPARA